MASQFNKISARIFYGFCQEASSLYFSNCNKEVEIWCREKGKGEKFQFIKEILLKCIFGEDSCAPALGKLLLEIKQLGNIFSKLNFRNFLAATVFLTLMISL